MDDDQGRTDTMFLCPLCLSNGHLRYLAFRPDAQPLGMLRCQARRGRPRADHHRRVVLPGDAMSTRVATRATGLAECLGRTGGVGVAHIVASDDPKRGICGARLMGIVPRPGAGKCVVCLDLARSRFAVR
jgi:hypothetical protein